MLTQLARPAFLLPFSTDVSDLAESLPEPVRCENIPPLRTVFQLLLSTPGSTNVLRIPSVPSNWTQPALRSCVWSQFGLVSESCANYANGRDPPSKTRHARCHLSLFTSSSNGTRSDQPINSTKTIDVTTRRSPPPSPVCS